MKKSEKQPYELARLWFEGMSQSDIAEIEHVAHHRVRSDIRKALDDGVFTQEQYDERLSRAGYKGVNKINEGRFAAPPEPVPLELSRLRKKVHELEGASLADDEVRKHIFGLKDLDPEIPQWAVKAGGKAKIPGVPSLFISDIHYSEVVASDEVYGVNSYGKDVARARIERMASRTIDLLSNHVVNPVYPGIVIPVGGDLLSGEIHEELAATNEIPIMSAVAELYGIFVRFFETMADTFGHVLVPWVSGNHGRTTRKPRYKRSAATNYDYLIGLILEKHFENDKRIKFIVPTSKDCNFRIYNHRYSLTHGDDFKVGDAIIGHIGAVLRGDNRKRMRNSQIGEEYDTMLVAHFHSLLMTPRVIVNGSVKGYDEYASGRVLPFERPQQALWITHPVNGITFSCPVFLDEKRKGMESSWTSWK